MPPASPVSSRPVSRRSFRWILLILVVLIALLGGALALKASIKARVLEGCALLAPLADIQVGSVEISLWERSIRLENVTLIPMPELVYGVITGRSLPENSPELSDLSKKSKNLRVIIPVLEGSGMDIMSFVGCSGKDSIMRMIRLENLSMEWNNQPVLTLQDMAISGVILRSNAFFASLGQQGNMRAGQAWQALSNLFYSSQSSAFTHMELAWDGIRLHVDNHTEGYSNMQRTEDIRTDGITVSLFGQTALTVGSQSMDSLETTMAFLELDVNAPEGDESLQTAVQSYLRGNPNALWNNITPMRMKNFRLNNIALDFSGFTAACDEIVLDMEMLSDTIAVHTGVTGLKPGTAMQDLILAWLADEDKFDDSAVAHLLDNGLNLNAVMTASAKNDGSGAQQGLVKIAVHDVALGGFDLETAWDLTTYVCHSLRIHMENNSWLDLAIAIAGQQKMLGSADFDDALDALHEYVKNKQRMKNFFVVPVAVAAGVERMLSEDIGITVDVRRKKGMTPQVQQTLTSDYYEFSLTPYP